VSGTRQQSSVVPQQGGTEKVESSYQAVEKSSAIAPTRGIDKYIAPEHGSENEDDDYEESSSEDEEELIRELEKIKAEKAAAAAAAQKIKEEEALNANPLLSTVAGGSGGALKRQWYQDTVFSNTRKSAPGVPPEKKQNINDSIRNESHKKFLRKYIG
jgi:protein CWC15